MALINCAECSREISDKAKTCPHCGYPIKTKGKGFAIASLVLGTIACIYSFSAMFASKTYASQIVTIMSVVYIMIFAVLALIFGVVSHKKGCKLKKKTAGIILSIISIIILLATLVTVL